MRAKWIWIVLFVDFAALNLYALATSGLMGLWHTLIQLSPWGMVLTADLLIALSIGMAWMWRDAARRGVSPTPFAVVTLLTGSFGLLWYLMRFWSPPQERAANAA